MQPDNKRPRDESQEEDKPNHKSKHNASNLGMFAESNSSTELATVVASLSESLNRFEKKVGEKLDSLTNQVTIVENRLSDSMFSQAQELKMRYYSVVKLHTARIVKSNGYNVDISLIKELAILHVYYKNPRSRNKFFECIKMLSRLINTPNITIPSIYKSKDNLKKIVFICLVHGGLFSVGDLSKVYSEIFAGNINDIDPSTYPAECQKIITEHILPHITKPGSSSSARASGPA